MFQPAGSHSRHASSTNLVPDTLMMPAGRPGCASPACMIQNDRMLFDSWSSLQPECCRSILHDSGVLGGALDGLHRARRHAAGCYHITCCHQ